MDTIDNELVAILEESLCAVAEADEDITPHFFDRFFAEHPEHRAEFFHPSITCGPMVNEMLENLMALAMQESWVRGNIQGLVIAHRSFGDIPLPIYGKTLDLLVDTLAKVAGDRWTPEFDAAWRNQCAILKDIIARAY